MIVRITRRFPPGDMTRIHDEEVTTAINRRQKVEDLKGITQRERRLKATR
jgi:hypothetical protein